MTEFIVTESALEQLASKIRRPGNGAAEDFCFRLTVDSAGDPEIALGEPQPNDRSFYYEGRTVLVVASDLAGQYTGRILDLNLAGDFVLA